MQLTNSIYLDAAPGIRRKSYAKPYILSLTTFYVDNGKNLRLWNKSPE